MVLSNMRSLVPSFWAMAIVVVLGLSACGKEDAAQGDAGPITGGVGGPGVPIGGAATGGGTMPPGAGTGGTPTTPTGGAPVTPTGGAPVTPTGGAPVTPTAGAAGTPTGGAPVTPTAGAAGTPTAGTQSTAGSGTAGDMPDGGPQTPDAAADAVAPADSGGGDIPITGTFPPVDDPWAPGPYTANTVDLTGPGAAYTLYHPTDLAPNGVLNPIITWGNGGATVPALYPMLPFFATHGFVVIAANSPMASGQGLSDGVDWLIQQNGDPSSEFYGKLDTEKIGAMGYSMGSLAVYEMLDYPNLVTTVHMSGGLIGDSSQAANEPGPTCYISDPADTKANCDSDYAVVTVPVFYGSLLGANHVAMMLPPYSDLIAGAATAWFRWFLMEDESQRSVFVGADCQLCQDPAWSVQQKNW